LRTLSAVYGHVARLRRSWYERRPHTRRELRRPVVSIGNLAVGGSGKTPVAAAVARLLIEAGERPSILSRGFARRRPAEGVVAVSDGIQVLASVDDSGDEPQMLARMLPSVPVLVSADRYLGGSLAERRFGCTVHILDDGFQHLQLARTVDLLLVHPRDLSDRVLPAGRLRERHDAARAADALLVDGTLEEADVVATALGVSTTFRIEPQFSAARWLRPESAADAPPASGRVVAVTGIARPERFFDALRRLGWDVAREMAFPDHHWFAAADYRRIAAAVVDTGADGVITTEKDAVRVTATQSEPVWAVLPMEISIEPRDAFAPWLLARLARHARGNAEPEDGLDRRSPKGEGE
jgi:tetraacyldisaccharide 4'-kinase